MIWNVKSKTIKLIVDILKDILLQVWFVFESDRIVMYNIDDEKMVSVCLNLKPPLEEYRCATPVVFSFYIQSLFKIMRGVPRDDMLVFKIQERELNIMSIRWNKDPSPTFYLHSLPDENPQYQLDYAGLSTFDLEIDAQSFFSAIRDLSAVGKLLVVTREPEEITFTTTNEFKTSAIYSWPMPHKDEHKVIGRYIIKYIEKFSKPGLCDTIRLQFDHIAGDEKYLLKCEWNMCFGYLRLNVAPLP